MVAFQIHFQIKRWDALHHTPALPNKAPEGASCLCSLGFSAMYFNTPT
jgi:hypothetical protein